MRRKRVILPAIAVVLCIVLGIGAFLFVSERRIDNVFDEMYQSVKHPTLTDARFSYVQELGRTESIGYSDNLLMAEYKPESINQGEDITLYIHTDNNTVLVLATVEIKDNKCLYFKYYYHFDTKTLEIEPLDIFIMYSVYYDIDLGTDNGEDVSAFLHENHISREDVERYRDYFLYDKVLADWLNGNKEHSRFSTSDYGSFRIVDNTFAHLGEGWT